MTRRISVVLVALFALMVAGASAATGTTKTVHLSGTIRGAIADTATPGKIKIAGTVTDRALRAGAIVFDQASIGARAKSPFTAYTTNGSFRGISTSDNTQNPDGSLTIANGTFTITSGGGKYHDAKGKGTFQGTSDGAGHITLTYKGTFTYTKK